MKLSGDVRNFDGLILLSQGTSLTDKHIETFKAWGVSEAPIREGNGHPREEEKIDPRLSAQVQAEMDELFRYANKDHPAVEEMLRLAVLYKLKNKRGQESS